MSDALVSIVLPTYNGARYLRESLDSVLAQTHENWQLVVVDDGSADETPQIIAEYAERDPRIETIRHERNQGMARGLNDGFAAARGDYLTWTSDDNRYKPSALADMVAFLAERPDVGLVYTDYTVIDADGNEVSRERVRDPSWLVYMNVLMGCFLYRREVREAVGANAEDLGVAEDFDYWLRVSTRFALEPLHENLYEYRYHPASLTMSGPDALQDSVDRVLERNLPTLRWAGRKRRLLASKTLAKRVWLRGHRRMALAIGLRSLKTLVTG
jgi:glycosyltransferase involved in cell wall biosynthesis